jgi:hypothetical protein
MEIIYSIGNRRPGFYLLIYAGDLGQRNWPILGLAAADFALAPRRIIPPARIILSRAEYFSDKERTRRRLKNVIVSY